MSIHRRSKRLIRGLAIALAIWTLHLHAGNAIAADTIKPSAAPDGNVKTIELPAPATEAVLAGGGKYLLLPIPRLRVVALADLAAGEVVSYLRVDSNDFTVAGGASKAIVLLKDRRLLQRWDLASGTREAESPLTVDPGPMAMGISSEGPVLIGRNFVDPATLKRKPIAVRVATAPGAPEQGGFGGFRPEIARARPDGKAFAAGAALLVIDGDTAVVSSDKRVYEMSPPPAELGNQFASAVIVGFHGSPYASKWATEAPRDAKPIPTVHPDFVVVLDVSSIETNRSLRGDGRRQRYNVSGAVYGARFGDGKKPASLPEMPELSGVGQIEDGVMPIAERLLVDPTAGRVITIPASCDRVFVRAIAPIQP